MKYLYKITLLVLLAVIVSLGQVPNIDFIDNGDITIPKKCRLTIKKSIKDKLKYDEIGRYYFTITNTGNGWCKGIIVRDKLPNNVQYTSSQGDWTCNDNNSNPQSVQCSHDSIAPHTSSHFSIDVDMPDQANGVGYGWKDNTVKNCASVYPRYLMPVSNQLSSKKIKPPFDFDIKPNYSCVTTKLELPNPKFCSADTMLVIDKSGSMTWDTRLQKVKTASIGFAAHALSYPDNKVGVGSFNSSATLNLNLSTNLSLVTNTINSIHAGGGTNINTGFDIGFQELNNSSLQKRILVLLSDGISNPQLDVTSTIAEAQNENILIYTIGVGSAASAQLEPVATGAGGLYFQNAATQADLIKIYEDIASDACQAVISGIKFNDQNGNGVRDTGEPPVGNVMITLINASGAIVSNTTTASDGSYRFSNVTPGSYTVKEIVPSGWTQTFPVSGVHNVTIAQSQHINHLDFGNIHKVDMHILGMKFHDLNNNHQKDAGEPPLKDVIIKLYSADSNGNPVGLIATTTTDMNGKYSFTGLNAGNYLVREVVTSLGNGWTQTYPLTNYGAHSVVLAQGSSKEGLDFGNATCENICDATLYGFKFHDENMNGIYDPGELKISGWPIEYTDASGHYHLLTTDSNGEYSITIPHDQLNETVTLSEWILPGWQVVTPPLGIYSNIDVTFGDHLEFNFANADICDTPNKNRGSTTDLSIEISKSRKQIIIENKGKAPSGRIGLLIKNNINISSFNKLSKWKCSSNEAMNQTSCQFKGVLNPGQKTMLPLDFDKTVKGKIILFTENDADLRNNGIYFSKEKIYRVDTRPKLVIDSSTKAPK